MNIMFNPATYAELLHEGDFVVLDTETTGLDSPEACEITILDKNGNVLLDSLVKTSKEVQQSAYEIHGISSEMLENAPSWNELHDKFIEAVSGKTVLIYNSNFDVTVIENTMKAAGLDTVPYKTECLMNLYAEYNDEWDEVRDQYRWKKLVDAAAHFGIETEGAHRAKADCLMTLGVLKGMAGKLEQEPEQKVKNGSKQRRKP